MSLITTRHCVLYSILSEPFLINPVIEYPTEVAQYSFHRCCVILWVYQLLRPFTRSEKVFFAKAAQRKV